jgi:hypothetical protein
MKMQWRSLTRDGEKVLYLQNDGIWIHYNASKYALPDYDAKHSKGWATFQKLHKAGWELIPSE